MGTPKAFLSVAYLVASSRALWARPVAPAATCHSHRKHTLVKYLLAAVLDLGNFEEGGGCEVHKMISCSPCHSIFYIINTIEIIVWIRRLIYFLDTCCLINNSFIRQFLFYQIQNKKLFANHNFYWLHLTSGKEYKYGNFWIFIFFTQKLKN